MEASNWGSIPDLNSFLQADVELSCDGCPSMITPLLEFIGRALYGVMALQSRFLTIIQFHARTRSFI
ncbi:MAG: hypothetical protein K0S45_2334 [Nitrospira sp.]|nr:hypothetical protein [Nitrospira sp.]